MFLSRSIARVILCLLVSTASSIGAETGPILFSNPLIRDSTVVAKLDTIRFVTVDGFAPFSSFDESGTLRGVHVDLARNICTAMGISAGCTIQVVAFEDIENLLTTGKADIALAGIVPSVQNRKNLDFSVPYFRYPSKFLTQKGKSLAKAAVIGVINDSTHQEMAKLMFPDLKQTAFGSLTEAMAALKAGSISAVFGDGLSFAISDDACCQLQIENYFLPSIRPDTLSAATDKNRNDILAAVNSALRQMASDGSLDEIYLRQMPVNPLQ